MWVTVWVLTGCGGGGGGGGSTDDGGGAAASYANVQPAAAPAPESFDPAVVSGTVSGAGDTLDAAGRVAGIVVELHEIQGDGSLGPVQASATTGAGGSFSMAMPAGGHTGDGHWMLTAQTSGGTLRAYLYPGAVRLDASSEAWVRQVVAATGHLSSFPAAAVDTLGDIARAMALYADATGDRHPGLAAPAAADWILQSLSRDHSMNYLVSTLSGTGALPTSGIGDLGSFYALSDTYAAFFVDQDRQSMLVTVRGQSGAAMAADGTWPYRASPSSMVGGQWTPIPGAGSDGRLTPSRGYQRLQGDGTTLSLISGVIGEYPSESFPVRIGARQLDARRIASTNLNFTGGSDEQPLAFSLNETVGGIETLTLAAGSFRAARVTSDLQIVVPTSATAVSKLVLRTTLWLAPGAGILKELDQVFVDGVEDATSAETLELSSAYANNIVWPAQVSMSANFITASASTHFCPPIPIPGLRRFVTVEQGPTSDGTPRLALALWDMDNGQQIGTSRLFTGNSAFCPVGAGNDASVLVPETFSERNLLST